MPASMDDIRRVAEAARDTATAADNLLSQIASTPPASDQYNVLKKSQRSVRDLESFRNDVARELGVAKHINFSSAIVRRATRLATERERFARQIEALSIALGLEKHAPAFDQHQKIEQLMRPTRHGDARESAHIANQDRIARQRDAALAEVDRLKGVVAALAKIGADSRGTIVDMARNVGVEGPDAAAREAIEVDAKARVDTFRAQIDTLKSQLAEAQEAARGAERRFELRNGQYWEARAGMKAARRELRAITVAPTDEHLKAFRARVKELTGFSGQEVDDYTIAKRVMEMVAGHQGREALVRRAQSLKRERDVALKESLAAEAERDKALTRVERHDSARLHANQRVERLTRERDAAINRATQAAGELGLYRHEVERMEGVLNARADELNKINPLYRKAVQDLGNEISESARLRNRLREYSDVRATALRELAMAKEDRRISGHRADVATESLKESNALVDTLRKVVADLQAERPKPVTNRPYAPLDGERVWGQYPDTVGYGELAGKWTFGAYSPEGPATADAAGNGPDTHAVLIREGNGKARVLRSSLSLSRPIGAVHAETGEVR